MTWTASNRINSNQISGLFRLNWPDPIFVSEVAWLCFSIRSEFRATFRIGLSLRRWSVADRDYRTAPRSTPAAHVLNRADAFFFSVVAVSAGTRRARSVRRTNTSVSRRLSELRGPCDQVTVHQRAPQINPINFTQCESDPSV